jgi:hypothetical protein
MISISRLCSVDGKMINEYGAVGGMSTGRGNGSSRRKFAPVPLRVRFSTCFSTYVFFSQRLLQEVFTRINRLVG